MRRSTVFTYLVVALLAPLLVLLIWAEPMPAQAGPSRQAGALAPISLANQVFLPSLRRDPMPTPTPTPTVPPPTVPPPTAPSVQDVIWDPRLDQRGAVLVHAAVQPGQGYWKLISGAWYDVTDPLPFGVGDHDIAADVKDASNTRIVDKNLGIAWDPGQVAIMVTQAKPGEPFAATFPMYHLAPCYAAQVDDGAPSDSVRGLGMGSIVDPIHKVHTSYSFVWRWTVAPADATTTPTAIPVVTASPTPTPTGLPGLVWDQRLTQRGAEVVPAQPQPGQGYWRLVRGQWYDVNEEPFTNQGLILVDTLDQAGARQTGVSVQISGMDGTPLGVIDSESQPGELYAGNFALGNPAPAYRAAPAGAPADMVTGMGLGSLANPYGWDATRYGLVWQWTVAPAGPAPAGGINIAPALAASGSSLSNLPAAEGSPLFRVALLALRCDGAAAALSGSLLLDGKLVPGYRVVYSAEPDGAWAAPPIEAASARYRTNAASAPANGEWYVWAIDGTGARVSLIVPWRPGGCGAVLSFSN